MFNKIRAKARKHRRRKSMSKRGLRGRRGGGFKMRLMPLRSILMIAGLAVAAAGLVLLIIFVIVPLFGPQETPEETAADTTATVAPTPSAPPIAKEDMSQGAKELIIDYKSINDPYVFGNEVVFSTGNPLQAAPELTTIAVYYMDTEQTSEISGIVKKYISLFEPKINDNYIVYLDCKTEYGGAVCGYDKNTQEMFVMREYIYGKPKVTLVGDYALWMQQTGNATDKLYLYHLPTKESVVIEDFINTPFSISAPFMSDESVIFVQPSGETPLKKDTSGSMDAEIRIIPLKDNGDSQSVFFLPDTYVYDPMIQGDNIIFIDGNRDENSRLMLCTKDNDTYTAPEVIAQGVLNYKVGDGFVAYTKDEGIYIYYFEDASTGRLSSDNTRALLSSANGKDVVWYDVTDGLGAAANVIIHTEVP